MGLAVPFQTESKPNIARLHQFIAEQRYRPRGKHHEIYLSHPNRSALEKSASRRAGRLMH